MSDIILTRPNSRNLERAKTAVQQIAKKRPETPCLTQFGTSKSWFYGDQKVTGLEMNNFVASIQTLFSQINKENIDTYKQFATVYNFLDILDKEYIKYFNQSIDKLEVVTYEARKAGNDALSAQREIGRTIQALKLTIEKLASNKAEVDDKISLLANRVSSFENDVKIKTTQLNRFDDIMRSLESNNFFLEIETIHNDVLSHKVEITALNTHLETVLNTLEVLENHKTRIEHIKHIDEIDNIWEDVKEINSDIPFVFSTISDIKSHLDLLEEHKSRIEHLKHIDEIDNIWVSVKKTSYDIPLIYSKLASVYLSLESLDQYKTRLSSINHIMDIDTLWDDLQTSKKEIVKIKDEQELMNSNHAECEIKLSTDIEILKNEVELNKKKAHKHIVIAYTISGVALFLAIIQFILNFK